MPIFCAYRVVKGLQGQSTAIEWQGLESRAPLSLFLAAKLLRPLLHGDVHLVGLLASAHFP